MSIIYFVNQLHFLKKVLAFHALGEVSFFYAVEKI